MAPDAHFASYRNTTTPARIEAAIPLPSATDILIVGAGPAGLALATQLSRFPDLSVTLIERKPGKLEKGHADGLQLRTLEIFQALGFAHQVIAEAYQMNEMTFWEPSEAGGIYRAGRLKDTTRGMSEMPHVILTQARLHELMLERIAASERPVAPFYSCRLESVSERDEQGRHIASILETDASGKQTRRTPHARYVVGCDGAHSSVREALHLPVCGDSANSLWGVADCIAETNFPDIRVKVGIRSSADGSILIIPKAECNHLVSRIYVELEQLEPGQSAHDRQWPKDAIASKAARIFAPYEFTVKETLWESFYEIGQRICDTFDNATPGAAPSVFISGDACHTHSPKGGQGMNTSVQDSFNLAWKLALTARGLASPDILRTYSTERHAVAQELIDFDRDLTRAFSSHAHPTPQDKDKLRDTVAKKAEFSAGLSVRYADNMLILPAAQTRQHLAPGYPVGKRFHSSTVLRCADACPVQLGHALVADGRFRLVVFAGQLDAPTDTSSRTARLCGFLQGTLLNKFTPPGQDTDSVIGTLAVFCAASHRDFGLDQVHPVLWPARTKYHGARDYRKVFTDRWDGGDAMESVYDARGVDKRCGCVVIVRPDGYVAGVTGLEDYEVLERYFGRFLCC